MIKHSHATFNKPTPKRALLCMSVINRNFYISFRKPKKPSKPDKPEKPEPIIVTFLDIP